MRGCPRCKTPYHSDVEFCGIDGEKLVEMDVDPMIGATIDRYRVIERLGGGGMAAVYRAVHTVIDRECALKVLFGELASDRAFAERFRREARAASEIKHENVVEILDFGTTKEGASFLLMELLKGTTLSAALPKGGLPPERAALILRDIACGLAAAHARGFVHRDLKPQNIMLVDDASKGRERAKILDFGLVAEQSEGGEALTKTGQTLGTPSYMSPEQIDGKGCTPKSDLYSLGVILYEMLAGVRPFTGTLAEILVKHRSEKPETLPPAKGLELLAAKLLEKSPADRPGSAVDVVRAIEALGLVNEPPAVLPDPAAIDESTRADRRKEPVSATAETRVTNPPSLPSSAILKVSSSAVVDADPIRAPARFTMAQKLGAVVVVALVAGGVYFARTNPSSPFFASSDASDGGPSSTTPVDKAVDKVVDVGQKAVDAALATPGADAGIDDATLKKDAIAKANDDVLSALKRRSLSWNDAEGLPNMKPVFGAFERAKSGDPSGLRNATKDLVHEIARAPISARLLADRLDRVAHQIKRANLSKQKRAEYEKKLDSLRAQARRGKTEAERNKLFVEAVALDDRVN